MDGMGLLHTMTRRARAARTRQDGFTLVETIVASVVAAILITAVVGILAFTARSMAYQKAQDNALTLASTVKASIESTLRDARITKVKTGQANAASISFTTTQRTSYLGNSGEKYVLAVKGGQLCIAQDKDGKGSPADADFKSLLPGKTYIDGLSINWDVSGNANRALVKIYAPANLPADSPTTQTVIGEAGTS